MLFISAIAEDNFRPGLYKEYNPDYFDLIIVDECHRGSARSESSWRSILEYFEPREEYDKISFNIIDYTKSTVLFEDPDFDGEPALIQESEIDDEGQVIPSETEEQKDKDTEQDGFRGLPSDEDELPRKYYVDGGTEEIVEEQIYDPDAENQLRLSKLIDHTKEQVRILYRSTLEIQQKWADPVLAIASD